MPFYQSQQILLCSTSHYKFHPAQYLIWMTAVPICILCFSKTTFFALIQVSWYTSESFTVWHGIWVENLFWMKTANKTVLCSIPSQWNQNHRTIDHLLLVDFAFKKPTLMSVYILFTTNTIKINSGILLSKSS